VTWAAWADIDPSGKLEEPNQARSGEIPAAFLFGCEFNNIYVDFNFIELYETKERFIFVK